MKSIAESLIKEFHLTKADKDKIDKTRKGYYNTREDYIRQKIKELDMDDKIRQIIYNAFLTRLSVIFASILSLSALVKWNSFIRLSAIEYEGISSFKTPYYFSPISFLNFFNSSGSFNISSRTMQY